MTRTVPQRTLVPRLAPSSIVVRTIVTAQERAGAFAVRRSVFIEEQGVSEEEEFDEDDERATHALAAREGIAVGTGRVLLASDAARIGRMAVLAEYRGCGVGRRLLEHLVQIAGARGCRRVFLNAQRQAIPFYERSGFRAVGPEFQEVGIAHRRMERHLSARAEEAAGS